VKLTGAVIALIAATVTVAEAGDPYREYFTIETDHFVVHYVGGLEDVARRIAVVGEAAHRTLTPALDHVPEEKTIIVVVDNTDSANGFAGVIPRNAITLYATGPGSNTELEDHEDWLYALTLHEYTHIVHLDTMGPLPRIYNRILGKTWAPNQIMPRWIIEGIATYEETKRTAGGRGRGTRFESIMRIARHADKDLRLDEITGAPKQFPRGNAAYIYGSHFLRYIFDRFGDDTLRQMSHTSGDWPIPFALNRQIAKVTGEPFTELYDDWKGHLRDRYGMQELAAERRGLAIGKRLTHTAELNYWPQYTADGKELYWLQSDGKRRPHVRAMPIGSDDARARDVAQIEAMGPYDVLTDGSFVFEQGGRVYRREYAFQDLYRYDVKTGRELAITHGMRARDPAVSPDERRVAFSKNEKSESVLAVVDTAPGGEVSVVWRGERFDQAYQPSWSPDGKRIAFSAWRKGGFRDILVVELASGAVEEITNDRALDEDPSWSADGRYLFFDSDRTGIQNIYAWDTQTRVLSQITNVLGGAYRPSSSPDGTRLAFDAAVPEGGSDVYEIALDPQTWLPARPYLDDKPVARDISNAETEVSAPRAYRPMETLAPQSYTVQTSLTAENPTVNLQTGGADAFNDHSWALSLGSNLDNGDLNISAFYGYGGWRWPLRTAVSRTISDRSGFRVDGVSQPYRQEDWSATISSSVPFEGRPDSSWSMSFDYDFDYFRLVEEPLVPMDPSDRIPVRPIADYQQAGVGVRVAYSRVRGVTFGLGPSTGFDFSASVRLDHPALGATYRNVTAGYSTQAFTRLWGETPTLYARLVGSYRAGDIIRGGGFALGGTPTQDVVRAIIDSLRAGTTGFLRGYRQRDIFGNQFHLLNLEYRQELWTIERGVATLPIYFRRLHLGLLSDTGVAFDTTFDAERNLRTSVGAALRLDAYFGYFIPGTFEIGYSHGLTETGISETWLLLTGSL
jgi:Tol biopolymer transport system component